MEKGRKALATAVVLAAGRGTRLRSKQPKVLHEVAGRPLLSWVLSAARSAGCEDLHVIVGHLAEEVRSHFAQEGINWVSQEEQKGTGHALAQVEAHLQGEGRILVLSGDVPLVRGRTLKKLISAAEKGWGAMAVADPPDAGSLGRVEVQDGALKRIVEAADASPEEIALPTVNAGLYVLPAPEIFAFLSRLAPDNAKGEFYLTEALNMVAAEGHRIELVTLDDPSEAAGVNSRQELGEAHRTLLRRRADSLMSAGVTLLDPGSAVIAPDVEVGCDTVLHPEVSLLGSTVVGEDCVLHRGAWLKDCRLADGVVIEPYSVLEGASIGPHCRIGPFARLRPGAELERGAKVGNFVEVKNAQLGKGVKAGHLTYLGDVKVGERANIGAGVVTCNYDGERKHRTVIGSEAFVGSDTMLVAPVEVGDRATTGAGSVITRDVPDDALAVERGRQRHFLDWRNRRDSGKDED